MLSAPDPMSHDPLLDKIREVRALLTAFRNTLMIQKRFTDETASIFSREDREFWAFQEQHERLKHAGISSPRRDHMMKVLAKKAAQWSRLCAIAKSGAPLAMDFMKDGKASS